jgi:hypothetical protein
VRIAPRRRFSCPSRTDPAVGSRRSRVLVCTNCSRVIPFPRGRLRRKAKARRAPAKTAGAPLSDWAASSDGARTVGKQKPSERRPRRLEFFKLGTLELVDLNGRSHGDAVVRDGRSDLNTYFRIPRGKRASVAAKSITLATRSGPALWWGWVGRPDTAGTCRPRRRLAALTPRTRTGSVLRPLLARVRLCMLQTSQPGSVPR